MKKDVKKKKKKGQKQIVLNINKLLNKLKQIIIENKNIVFLAIPFILIDIITRILGRKIHFFNILNPIPNLFTLVWIFLILGISINLNKKKGKITYTIFFIL